MRAFPCFAVVAATAAGLLALACRGSSATPEPARETAPASGKIEIAFETVLQRSIPGQPGGEIREAARDEASWKALWDGRRQDGEGIGIPS